jgi:hypothetical protein
MKIPTGRPINRQRTAIVARYLGFIVVPPEYRKWTTGETVGMTGGETP